MLYHMDINFGNIIFLDICRCAFKVFGYGFFLDLRPWLEGSYNIGSFRPSIRHSDCPWVFSELAHQFFLKLSMMLGAHIQLCVTEPDFLAKSPSGKNDQKWSKWTKTCFLEFLRKSHHQFCLEFVLNESSYGSLTFCENCMLGKNLVLKLQPKMALGQ